MKRLFSLLLAALLLLAAGAGAEELEELSPLVGTWKMTKYTVGKRTVNDPEAAGSLKTLEFSQDGAALMTLNGEEYPGAWTLEGDTLRLDYEDGDRAEFAWEERQLVYRVGDQVQYFTQLRSLREEARLVGCWETANAPAARRTAIFRPDGTGFCVLEEEGVRAFSFTWQLEADRVLATRDGGILDTYRLSEDGLAAPDQAEMRKKEDWPLEIPEAAEAGGEEAFLGRWTLCALDATPFGIGSLLPGAVYSARMSLTVSAEDARLYTSVPTQNTQSMRLFRWEMREGALALLPRVDTPEEAEALPLALCANGWIALQMPVSDTETVTLYFMRTEE